MDSLVIYYPEKILNSKMYIIIIFDFRLIIINNNFFLFVIIISYKIHIPLLWADYNMYKTFY